MPLTTRTRLRQDAARLTGLLLWSGVATGGSTSALTHTGSGGLRDSGMSTYLFEGAYLHITGTTDNAAPLGEWRMITPTGYDPTASVLQITVGEVFSAPIGAGDSYEIIAGLDPDEWNDTLNATLTQQLRYKWRSPLTLITDGDMEEAGTDYWTAIGSAILVKGTTGSHMTGTQALHVVGFGNSGAVSAANVPCNPGDSFSLWADYTSDGTAELVAWDTTGGAEIAAETGTGTGTLHLSFAAPAMCRSIVVILRQIEVGVTGWDNVILLQGGRLRYALPSWIEERDQLELLQTRVGNNPLDHQYPTTNWPLDIEEALTTATPFQVVVPGTTSGPYFVSGQRKFSALPTESATTAAPLEWAKYEVASAAYEIMGDEWRPRTRNYVGRNEVEKHLHSLRQLNQPREPKSVGGKRPWTASRGFTW